MKSMRIVVALGVMMSLFIASIAEAGQAKHSAAWYKTHPQKHSAAWYKAHSAKHSAAWYKAHPQKHSAAWYKTHQKM